MAGRIAQLSFFFLRRSFFAGLCRRSTVVDRRYRKRTNEVERSNILAPGFRHRIHDANLPPAFTAGLCRTIGPGKSYPVTAAQLLPIRTGFLAPIHVSKLAKNWVDK